MTVQGDPNFVHGVATNVFKDGKYTFVVYRETAVVKFSDSEIILNKGGWETQTTKNRMNQASNEKSLGYVVRAKKGNWTVEFGEDVLDFDEDTLTLQR